MINPLDELFGMPPNATNDVTEYQQVTEGELAPVNEGDMRDDEDRDTDRKMDEIYSVALEAFHAQTEYVQIAEPRYASRIAEVAAQYLNIALTANTNKAKIKTERKKAGAAVTAAGKPASTNVVVASREEIMRMISVDADTQPI